jgi:hypothetical protein
MQSCRQLASTPQAYFWQVGENERMTARSAKRDTVVAVVFQIRVSLLHLTLASLGPGQHREKNRVSIDCVHFLEIHLTGPKIDDVSSSCLIFEVLLSDADGEFATPPCYIALQRV